MEILERQYCEYCHGITKADDYGNCKACGAQKGLSPVGNIMEANYKHCPKCKYGVVSFLHEEEYLPGTCSSYPSPIRVWKKYRCSSCGFEYEESSR